MNEEELRRIEEGDPASWGEIIVTLTLGVGVLGLLVYIIVTAW